MIDQTFRSAVIAAAERGATRALEQEPRDVTTLPHREVMRRVKALLAVYLNGGDGFAGSAAILEAAGRHVDALGALQSETGFFLGGDNVQSPPDTSFTINDVCDVIEFTRVASAEDDELTSVRNRLAAIVAAVTDSLLAGGVHTPNHRWELSAALTRIHRAFPDPRLLNRIDEWLAEGIDIDADGLYSEKSPNYAAHVSNPSLLTMAAVLNRPELRGIVERNLETTLTMIRLDDSVETVQSRRQDQKERFSLAPYLAHYRSLAVSTGRGDFAWAATRAAAQGIHDPGLLAELLLEPALGRELPAPVEPPQRSSGYLALSSLASHRAGRVESVVYGGSDFARHRRVRSGLANNPTFFRFFSGDAILDAVRLSRTFFDVGPFRAGAFARTADDEYRLEETIRAAYYQPLPPEARRPGGDYELIDDGRFSASMSFAERPKDELTMSTAIDVVLADDGAELRFAIHAPEVPWQLQLTFLPGGVFNGVERLGEHDWLLREPEGSYTVGGDRLVFGSGGKEPRPGVALYQPGQDYGFLGGTDATEGEHVYIAGIAPAEFALWFRAEPGAVR